MFEGLCLKMEKRGNVLMEKYEFGKLLGQGNFAKVYHARDVRTGESQSRKEDSSLLSLIQNRA